MKHWLECGDIVNINTDRPISAGVRVLCPRCGMLAGVVPVPPVTVTRIYHNPLGRVVQRETIIPAGPLRTHEYEWFAAFRVEDRQPTYAHWWPATARMYLNGMQVIAYRDVHGYAAQAGIENPLK